MSVFGGAALALVLGACGGGAAGTRSAASATRPVAAQPHTATHAVVRPKPPPAPPEVLDVVRGSSSTPLVPAVRWRDETAAWIARSASGVALLAFDQRLTRLRLHSGAIDAGAAGWRFGPAISGSELRRVVAAFNGGFRFSTNAGGFMSYGRTAVPLRPGLGSIVTYADGHTDIGAWHAGVPAYGGAVVSVRQNLMLLVDHGAPAPNLGCLTCWGATLGGVVAPARSALGITADGRLVWAGGEHLTVGGLAGALVGAGVVRAVELDINPEWVAGYLYARRPGSRPLQPLPVVPAQAGVPGLFLAPYSRDFFSVDAR